MSDCREGGKMQLTDYIGIAGLYTRLSRDDGTDSESNSIANQKRLLSQKAKELGFTNVKFYVDDGYTGTNFNRPGFQELIDHIDVYESEGKGKNKTQRIVIYYRFVGYIELPDKNTIVNDTRQGVAVNYISGTLPETA